MGHDNDDYRQLKDETEFLICKGKLNKFCRDGDRGDSRWDYDKRDDEHDRNPQPRGPVINMIFGGPTAARTSRNS